MMSDNSIDVDDISNQKLSQHGKINDSIGSGVVAKETKQSSHNEIFKVLHQNQKQDDNSKKSPPPKHQLRNKFKLAANKIQKDARREKIKKIAIKEVTGISVKDISKKFTCNSSIDPIEDENRRKMLRDMYRVGNGAREQYVNMCQNASVDNKNEPSVDISVEERISFFKEISADGATNASHLSNNALVVAFDKDNHHEIKCEEIGDGNSNVDNKNHSEESSSDDENVNHGACETDFTALGEDEDLNENYHDANHSEKASSDDKSHHVLSCKIDGNCESEKDGDANESNHDMNHSKEMTVIDDKRDHLRPCEIVINNDFMLEEEDDNCDVDDNRHDNIYLKEFCFDNKKNNLRLCDIGSNKGFAIEEDDDVIDSMCSATTSSSLKKINRVNQNDANNLIVDAAFEIDNNEDFVPQLEEDDADENCDNEPSLSPSPSHEIKVEPISDNKKINLARRIDFNNDFVAEEDDEDVDANHHSVPSLSLEMIDGSNQNDMNRPVEIAHENLSSAQAFGKCGRSNFSDACNERIVTSSASPILDSKDVKEENVSPQRTFNQESNSRHKVKIKNAINDFKVFNPFDDNIDNRSTAYDREKKSSMSSHNDQLIDELLANNSASMSKNNDNHNDELGKINKLSTNIISHEHFNKNTCCITTSNDTDKSTLASTRNYPTIINNKGSVKNASSIAPKNLDLVDKCESAWKKLLVIFFPCCRNDYKGY